MKLWKISQSENYDYDTYDSAVVAALTEDDARNISPAGSNWDRCLTSWDQCWTKPKNVRVEYLGDAKAGTEAGVIVASFNAG
jgi:hypothetical protein